MIAITKYIILLFLVLCLVVGINVIESNEVGVGTVIESFQNMNAATDLNNESNKKLLKETKAELEQLKSEEGQLREELDKLQAKYSELNVGSTENTENIDTSYMYGRLEEISRNNGAGLHKFYNVQVEGRDTYTISLTGKIDTIAKSVKEIEKEFEGYGMFMGSYSLRQNYDAYDLKRTYDDETRLGWYDGKFINANGEVLTREELAKLEDERKAREEEKRKEQLDKSKEALGEELVESNKYYDDKIKTLEDKRSAEIALIDKAGYDDHIAKSLKEKVEEKYKDSIASLKEDKEYHAEQIKKKQEGIDKAKEAAEEAKEDLLAQLKQKLADASKIEYILDITMG